MPVTRIGFNRGGGKRGFTFVELLISLAIMAVGFSAFLGVALESMQEYEFFTSLTLITQRNQEIVNTIRKDTLSTKLYFGEDVAPDTNSQDYMSALDLPAAFQPINTTRFPTIDELGLFEVDSAGNEKTGNSLFFVKTLSPFVATNVQVTDADFLDFRVSAYCFIFYYLTLFQNDTIGNSPDSLDMIRWCSFTVLDYKQIIEVDEERTDPISSNKYYPRAEIVAQFVNAFPAYSSHYLWDNSETVDNSFYLCDSFGTINGTPDGAMIILEDPDSGLTSMISGGIKRGRTYGTIRRGKRTSVCFNRNYPGFEGGVIVPELGIADGMGHGFPHGFEVQLIGPPSARELMLRVAVAKEGSRGIVTKDFKAILTTRDL